MIKTAIKILFAFHLVFLFPCLLQGESEASTETQHAEYIVNCINSIRSDPLSYAQDLGYDRQALLESLPWLNEFIEKDAELLTTDEFLNLRAVARNNPEPLEPDSDIPPGNDYAYTGETGGVVSFSNFMDSETALQIVIDNLFKQELAPGFQRQRYILSSDFDLAGASLTGKVIWDQTGRKNSYFITICFGSSLLKSEVQVLNMINQVRSNPLKIHNYILCSLSDLLDENYNAIYALIKTYQPLFLDMKLQKYAKAAVLEEEETANYLDQALYHGYDGVDVDKSSVIEIFPKTDSNSFATWIFSSLVLDELKAYPEKEVVFNPDFNEAGVAILFVNGAVYDSVKLTLIAGNKIEEDTSYSKIYGLIYNDIDENGVYAPGEGAAKETVIIYDKETFEKVKTAITDNAGRFSISLLNQKEYTIETGTGETKAEKDIYLDQDQFFELNKP